MTPYEILANSSHLANSNGRTGGPALGLSLSMLISEKAYRSVVAVERLVGRLKSHRAA